MELCVADFDSIYREYQPKIYRYLSSLCGEINAQDLTQSVFLKVSKSLDQFRGESSLATWIYRIATNTFNDHMGLMQVRQQQSELSFDENGSADDFTDGDVSGIDAEYIRQEMNACIREIVAQIPDSYRTALTLSDLEELSNAEIANIMGISIDTVKIRLHRGRTFLRRAMECQCSLYHDERNEFMCDRKK